jgi:nitrite reductase/ring-hydroxylating ferredoxin subunit/alkylhydroperoxidase/carboxymuconolactone decarboxylase family protein YurZ
MSEALDWLLAVRPGPLKAYFSFLKQSGSALDPKTRALISVITKVGAQTRRGFRQYLERALRAGCTADEVIDALLMAFPILGFTKIVWAVDRIIEMQLPEFAVERLTGAAAPAPAEAPTGASWVDVGALADFPLDDLAHVVAPRGGCFVRRVGEGVNVFRASCPHRHTPLTLADRDAAAGCIRCPRHGWRFDAATGAALEPAELPLASLPWRITAGRLLVCLEQIAGSGP